MLIFLLEEELGAERIDNNFNGADVQNAIVQELVEPIHVVVEEQLIHVHGVAGDGQLPGLDADAHQEGNDLVLGLLDGECAVDAALVESGRGVVGK